MRNAMRPRAKKRFMRKLCSWCKKIVKARAQATSLITIRTVPRSIRLCVGSGTGAFGRWQAGDRVSGGESRIAAPDYRGKNLRARCFTGGAGEEDGDRNR